MRKIVTRPLLSTGLLVLAAALPADAHHSGATCPVDTPASTNPPSSTVVVTILSVEPNSDLEGDDDLVPFYDNRADIYGTIVIAGEEHALPTIDESDHPFWNESDARFATHVTTGLVAISIRIRDADSGATGGDDVVDINRSETKADLDFMVDLCSMKVSGDVSDSAQGSIEATGGSGSSAARITFKVELLDTRPVSEDDLAVMELDLIQVVPQVDRIVAGKPTIARVRVANNYPFPVSTSVRLELGSTGVSTQQSFPISPALGAGEARTLYLFTDAPLKLPGGGAPYILGASATIDPGGVYSDYEPGDCRALNNSSGRRIWRVVNTTRPRILWSRVGALLDVIDPATDAEVENIQTLGKAFIRATYPIIDAPSDRSPLPLIMPQTAALDWMVTVLAGFGIPADSVLPFWLVFELNVPAVVAGYDRLFGVLPINWFDRFTYDLWQGVGGLSLVEFAPHAVIFLGRKPDPTGVQGPSLVLPAHELGHTYGLSVDSTLKDNVACGIDWPIVGTLPCGATGGYDEYKHPAMPEGNPASGYWVAQGGEPPALSGIVNTPQCDSHCMMGSVAGNAHLNWSQQRRWVDQADYDHLIDKLEANPTVSGAAGAILVSGMISWDDRGYLGSFFRLPPGAVDRTARDSKGLYGVRFLDGAGATLQEIGIPLHGNTPEFHTPIPATVFAFRAPFPAGARRIQIWNRKNGHLLAERPVTRNQPAVRIQAPVSGQSVRQSGALDVRLTGSDADGDKLTYVLLVSPNGTTWWPAAYQVGETTTSIPMTSLRPGGYTLKAVASDGVNTRESPPVRFHVTR